MKRKILLIRHGKTDANRLTRAAYGKAGAPLNSIGIAQAENLNKILQKLHIDFTQSVAVSEYQRTSQTAKLAGFKATTTSSLLNEVKTPDPVETQNMIAENKLPKEAVEAAQRLLAHPPKEAIWVTHGLLIAALIYITEGTAGVNIPDFCSVTTIEL